MGWGEEGGDVPWTLLPLCWVRRGFDGAGVGRESPQSPAPWESWWVEHVGLIRPGSRVRPNPGPAGPGPGDGPRGMGVGEKVGEANGDGGRAKGGGAPASSEVPSSSPSSSSSSPSSSLSTKALKAPPTIWGIGGGATGDHRGEEESLCKGDSTERGEVRGRDWESRELGKGGEEEEWRNWGRRKVGKGTHQSGGPNGWEFGGSSCGRGEKMLKSEEGGQIGGRGGWRQREQTSRKTSTRKRGRCHRPECPT